MTAANQNSSATPILEVKGLTKRFGGLTALEDVSFQLFPGEVLALAGDNGAGKSTLIKCISGAHLPSEGEIFFEGNPVSITTPHESRELGIETIYQDLALAENLDVGSNVFWAVNACAKSSESSPRWTESACAKPHGKCSRHLIFIPASSVPCVIFLVVNDKLWRLVAPFFGRPES
jgi:ABC-type sugar transport system ATPase subunit